MILPGVFARCLVSSVTRIWRYRPASDGRIPLVVSVPARPRCGVMKPSSRAAWMVLQSQTA